MTGKELMGTVSGEAMRTHDEGEGSGEAVRSHGEGGPSGRTADSDCRLLHHFVHKGSVWLACASTAQQPCIPLHRSKGVLMVVGKPAELAHIPAHL